MFVYKMDAEEKTGERPDVYGLYRIAAFSIFSSS